MTTTFSVTKDDVVKAAMQLGNLLAEGQSPSATQTTDATVFLQAMLKFWAVKGLKPWVYNTINFASTGAASYTIGPSGVVTPDRPLRVLQGWWRDPNGFDTPMSLLEKQRWDRTTPKSQAGLPNSFFYDAKIPNGVYYPWPVPTALASSGVTFYLSIQKHIEDLAAAGGSTFDIPQTWYLALIYGLAEFMIPWGVEERTARRIEKKAPDFLEAAADFTEEEGSSYFQPNPQGGFGYGKR